MPLSQGDILRVACRHKYGGIHDHINVMHLIYDTAAVPNTEASVLEDLAEVLGLAYDNLGAGLSSRLNAVDITVYNVTDDAPIGVTSWGSGYVGGTSVGNGLPFDSSAVCLFYTTVKRRIGKIFIGGILEADQNDGQMTGGLISNFGAFTAALLEMTAVANGGVYKYVVYSRALADWSLPSTIHIQPLLGSQDSRKPGRGS